VAAGGFADVWLGRYRGKDVAIKALRIYEENSIRVIYERFCNEAIQWKQMDHPNVVPFLGMDTSLFPLCMVSPWMSNGNITTYLKNNENADRLLLARPSFSL